MDQNENHSSMLETPTNNNETNINQYCYFSPFLLIDKTLLVLLRFVVPTVSLLFLSFLVISSYTTASPIFPTFSISSSSHNNNNIRFFSPLVLPLFTLTIQRKYIFLFCNVILAFLANKFSSFTPPPPPAASDDDLIPKLDDFANPDANLVVYHDQLSGLTKQVPLLQLIKQSTPEGGILSPQNSALAQELEQENGFFRIEDKESWALVTQSEDKGRDAEDAIEEVEEDSSGTKETYAGEQANEANANADELNKKFEEFIRKMKKEIRTEAQQ